ncbi:cytidylate kinase-like family protein [Eubacteriales bacterium OttesenSCG-928-K08]|nr:cytidylate kinase-like family protein [Eubacteriales bacterium OttesenSCG-928-K08]
MAGTIIAISRQFGSGGREIGLAVAHQLGIPCYDKELIALAAKHGELDQTRLADFDEKKESPWLYSVLYEGNDNVAKGEPVSAVLFKLQSEIIRTIAQTENAVIIGRCADHILRDSGAKLLTVFIAAPFDERVKRKMELEQLDQKHTEALVRKTDKQRRLYYQSNTNWRWGDASHFDLYFDSCTNSKDEIVNQIVNSYSKL